MSKEYLDTDGTLDLWNRTKSKYVWDIAWDTTPADPVLKKQSGLNGTWSTLFSVSALKTALALTKADVGLGNVDNTSDANKPISTAQQAALDLKAPLASPALTGNPTAPTQSTSDDSTKIATTAFVHDVIDGLSTGVTGVKGDAESTYRTGQVNLTPANLGITDFTGATSSAAGTNGLVPAPAQLPSAPYYKRALFADGTWKAIQLNASNAGDRIDIEILDDANHSLGKSTSIYPASWSESGSSISGTLGLMSGLSLCKLDRFHDTGGCWYATSSTAASTAAKVVTTSVNGYSGASSYYTLRDGTIIAVLFSTANTAATPTLNVDGTGAKSIYIGSSTPNSTSNVLKWSANTLIYFMYDSSANSNAGGYRYLGAVAAASVAQPRGANTWYGTCSTGASTAAKTATIDNFVLTKGAVVVLDMAYANIADSPTLNINSTGAKSIFFKTGVASSSNKFYWSGSRCMTFIYDGTYWRFVSVGTFISHSLTTLANGNTELTLVDDIGRMDMIAVKPLKWTDDDGANLLSIDDFTGTDVQQTVGSNGLVPAPNTGHPSQVLFASGGWRGLFLSGGTSGDTCLVDLRVDSSAGTKLSGASILPASESSPGVMTAADKTKLNKLVFDNSNKIDSSILPSYVDDVIEGYPVSGASELSAGWLSATSGGSALTPESGKIYVLMTATTNYNVGDEFRWTGTAYAKIADSGLTPISSAWRDANLV